MPSRMKRKSADLSQTFFPINEKIDMIENCQTYLYCDDLIIYIKCDPNNLNKTSVNTYIERIKEWFLNPSKNSNTTNKNRTKLISKL